LLFGWLGIGFLLAVLLFGIDLIRTLVRIFERLFHFAMQQQPGPADPGRRVVLARAFAGAASMTTAGLALYGVGSAVGDGDAREVPVRLPRLPRVLDGLTIVQLSDLHVGLTIGSDFVERVVTRTNQLRPDVIAITGDLADGGVAELAPLVEPLAR